MTKEAFTIALVRSRRLGTLLLILALGLLSLSGTILQRSQLNTSLDSLGTATSTRTLANSGSYGNDPRCTLQRSVELDNGNLHNYYICSRPNGSLFRADEIVPPPDPSWLSLCEVGTPSTIIGTSGANFGAAGYFLAANLGGPGMGFDFTNPSTGVAYIDFSGGDRTWTNTTGLVLDVENLESVPGRFEFSITAGGANTYTFVIAPNERRRISVALTANPPQWEPQYRWTGPAPIYQSDPTITPILRGSASSFNAGAVARIAFTVKNTYTGWSESLRVHSMRKTCQPINNYVGVLDQFGQLTNRGNFTGRVKTVQDLRDDAAIVENDSLPWGSSNAYLTPLSNPLVGANDGRWKFAKVDNKWTLVDPTGRKTKISGVNFMGGIPGDSSGQLAEIFNYPEIPGANMALMHQSLPDPAGVAYQSFRTIIGKNGYATQHFDAAVANLARKYNTADYLSQHVDRTTSRLRNWGLNTVGLPQDKVVTDKKLRTFQIAGLFRTTTNLTTTQGTMPNVFEASFATRAAEMATNMVADYNESDGMHIGFFSDNELEWGQKSVAASRFSVPIAVLKLAGTNTAKQALRQMLETKYTTIGALNAAWSTSYADWTAFQDNTHGSFATPTIGSTIGNDLDDFNELYANTYYGTIRTALTNANYQGLFLGTRYRGNAYTDEAIAACVTYCDAVSVNIYTSNPGASNPEFKTLDKPVIISEYSITTPGDNGKQSGGFETPVSPTAEAVLMDAIYDELQSWNNVVGTIWWEYMDQAVNGRFADAENLGFGLVSITDRPHTSTVTSLRRNTLEMETQW